MDIKNTIITLIKEYQETVAEGVECLNLKYNENPAFHKLTDESEIERHGFIESDKQTYYYEFHGINGCYMKWPNGKSVDFNLGITGRCDGFDKWFVLDFYRNNNPIRTKYSEVSIEDIDKVVFDLINDGDVIEDKFNDLYYFKEDYNNPNPFRWAGGEYSPQTDNE